MIGGETGDKGPVSNCCSHSQQVLVAQAAEPADQSNKAEGAEAVLTPLRHWMENHEA